MDVFEETKHLIPTVTLLTVAPKYFTIIHLLMGQGQLFVRYS